METLAFQSLVFSYTVYGGIVIGILYDLYRVICGRRKTRGVVTSIWDVLFLLAVLLVMIWAIFSSNYGVMRSYVFIGFVVGFFLYERILGRVLSSLFHALKRMIIRLFQSTNAMMLLPFKILTSLVWYPLEKMRHAIKFRKKRLTKMKKIPKILLEDGKKYYNLIIRRQIRKN